MHEDVEHSDSKTNSKTNTDSEEGHTDSTTHMDIDHVGSDDDPPPFYHFSDTEQSGSLDAAYNNEEADDDDEGGGGDEDSGNSDDNEDSENEDDREVVDSGQGAGAGDDIDRLRFKPTIVQYPNGEAGRTIPAPPGTENLNEDSDNPYAPFASKLDWEVAQWAKLRGQGSMAFSDLLHIDGVSNFFLCF